MSGHYDDNNICIDRNICNNIQGYGLNLKLINDIDSPYYVNTNDNIIFADASANEVFIKLFKGVKYLHPVFMIKKLDNSANFVQILPGDVGTTIESSPISYIIDRPDEVAEFIYDDINNDWKRITHDLKLGVNSLTNKGDLLSHNGIADEVLPIGANGNILSVDTTASNSLRWIPPGAHSHPVVYPLITIKIDNININWVSVAYFPWLDSKYSTYTFGKIIFRANIIDRSLDIQLFDNTNNISLGSLLNVALTGSYEFAVINPTSDAEIQLRLKKSTIGGTSPKLLGATLEFVV